MTVKLLAFAKVNWLMVCFFQCSFIASTTAAMLLMRGFKPEQLLGQPQNRHLLLSRGTIGFGGMCTHLAAINLLPLKVSREGDPSMLILPCAPPHNLPCNLPPPPLGPAIHPEALLLTPDPLDHWLTLPV